MYLAIMVVASFAFGPSSAIFVCILLLFGYNQSQMKIETGIIKQQVVLLNQRVELLTKQVNDNKKD